MALVVISSFELNRHDTHSVMKESETSEDTIITVDVDDPYLFAASSKDGGTKKQVLESLSRARSDVEALDEDKELNFEIRIEQTGDSADGNSDQ